MISQAKTKIITITLASASYPNKKHSQADTLWQHISKRNIK